MRCCLRDRHEEISSDKSYQTFYKPLFMTLCRIAEYWFGGIMCRQGKIFVCCFCMTSKSFFYSNTSIIKNDLLRRSAKMFKSFYDSFQKAFFILPVKSGNKDIPAVAFTHTPYLDFLLDPAKYYSCVCQSSDGKTWTNKKSEGTYKRISVPFCR